MRTLLFVLALATSAAAQAQEPWSPQVSGRLELLDARACAEGYLLSLTQKGDLSLTDQAGQTHRWGMGEEAALLLRCDRRGRVAWALRVHGVGRARGASVAPLGSAGWAWAGTLAGEVEVQSLTSDPGVELSLAPAGSFVLRVSPAGQLLSHSLHAGRELELTQRGGQVLAYGRSPARGFVAPLDASGRARWTAALGERVSVTRALLGPRRVYLAGYLRGATQLSGAQGAPGPRYETPRMEGGCVIGSEDNPFLACLERDSGRLRWSAQLHQPSSSGWVQDLLLAEGRLYLAAKAGDHTYVHDGVAGPSFESPTRTFLLSVDARDGGDPRWTVVPVSDPACDLRLLSPTRLALAGELGSEARAFAGVNLPAARGSAEAYLLELELAPLRASRVARLSGRYRGFFPQRGQSPLLAVRRWPRGKGLRYSLRGLAD